MRFTPIAAASALALGVLLGGITVSSGADAPETAQQRTVASAVSTSGAVLDDNNGNG